MVWIIPGLFYYWLAEALCKDWNVWLMFAKCQETGFILSISDVKNEALALGLLSKNCNQMCSKKHNKNIARVKSRCVCMTWIRNILKQKQLPHPFQRGHFVLSMLKKAGLDRNWDSQRFRRNIKIPKRWQGKGISEARFWERLKGPLTYIQVEVPKTKDVMWTFSVVQLKEVWLEDLCLWRKPNTSKMLLLSEELNAA